MTRPPKCMSAPDVRAPFARAGGFEATEPHIYSYYEQDVADVLKQGGFTCIEARENDQYNVGWLGVKPVSRWGI